MPASIFSETELARWASFPEEIPGDDLIRACTLTGADRGPRRPPAGGQQTAWGSRFSFCVLRYLGFVPRNLSAAPRSARLLCRGPALEAKGLEQLVDPQVARAGCFWREPGLHQERGGQTGVSFRQLGAPEWDLSDLNPNRRKFLAQVGRRSTSQTLQRMPDRRRYPILVVLLHETTLDLVDEIVDLFNRALKKTGSRSRRELSRPGESRPLRPPTRRSACSHVWDVSFSTRTSRTSSCVDAASRRSFPANSSRPRSRKPSSFSVRETAPISTSSRTAMAPLRKFAPGVLRVLDFKSLKTDDPLIDAVEILRELNRKRRRRVPEDAGLEFASAKWRGQLFGIRRASQSPVLRALCSLPTP